MYLNGIEYYKNVIKNLRSLSKGRLADLPTSLSEGGGFYHEKEYH